MASPQIENGYTKIANELFEALCGLRVPGEARQVLDVIIRKTYGFNKTEDEIALSQFCLLTRMNRQAVCRALNTLVMMNLIIKKETGNTNKWRINKDFDTWKPLSKKIRGVSKKITNVIEIDNETLSKKIHTKETIQKKKETKSDETSQEVSEVINAFKGINPSYQVFFARIPQRDATKRLLKVHEKQKLLDVIAFLPKTNGRPYFPSITSPIQLENKWAQLEGAIKRLKVEKQEVNPIII